jgi:hypothetical protein
MIKQLALLVAALAIGFVALSPSEATAGRGWRGGYVYGYNDYWCPPYAYYGYRYQPYGYYGYRYRPYYGYRRYGLYGNRGYAARRAYRRWR